MKQLITGYLLAAIFVVSASASGERSSNVKKPCEKYGVAGLTCNQCHDGGTLYEGQHVSDLFLDFTAGSEQTIVLANDPGTIKTQYFQDGFVWEESKDMWELNRKAFNAASPARGPYVALEPNQSAIRYVQTKPNTGIGFVSGPRGGGYRDIPSFLLTYTTKFYTKSSNFLEPKYYQTCMFYYSNWCGDGVRDPKEQCDMGVKNGVKGSECSSTCEENN